MSPIPSVPDVAADADAALSRLKQRRLFRRVLTAGAVTVSALLEAYVLVAFIQPAGLLSSGFTGLAILVSRVVGLLGIGTSTQLWMILLNLPVAALCWKSISRHFVLFSIAQVALTTAFMTAFEGMGVPAPISDRMLCVVVGGVLYGTAIGIALRGGASTAGTDFISLYVMQRNGMPIWGAVFAGNCVMLCVFGLLFGWESAAYSIVFQLLSTKTIEATYNRYDKVTMQVTTKRGREIADAYLRQFRHGMTIVPAIGAYSGEPVSILDAVLSSYELEDALQLVYEKDPNAVTKVLRTERFFGRFYATPSDEPVVVRVPIAEGTKDIKPRGVGRNSESGEQ